MFKGYNVYMCILCMYRYVYAYMGINYIDTDIKHIGQSPPKYPCSFYVIDTIFRAPLASYKN